MHEIIEPEFSRPMRIDQIPRAGMEYDIEATPTERVALAERFGLNAVDRLVAHIHLKAIAGGTLFRLKARLSASVVQTCVVTLEPFPAEVHEQFALTYGGAEDEEGGEIELSLDEEDPPEPVIDGIIDVGEAVAEHLALALDSFPRKDGASFETAPAAEPEPEAKPSPFAVLAQLRKNKG